MKGRKVGRTERTVGFKVGRTKGMTGRYCRREEGKKIQEERWENEKELYSRSEGEKNRVKCRKKGEKNRGSNGFVKYSISSSGCTVYNVLYSVQCASETMTLFLLLLLLMYIRRWWREGIHAQITGNKNIHAITVHSCKPLLPYIYNIHYTALYMLIPSFI